LNQPGLAVSGEEYFVRKACPCCGAPSAQATPVVSSDPPAETLTFTQHTGFMSGYGARRVFFTYARCGICDLLFCPTFYGHEQIERLYGRQAENMAEAPLSVREKTQERYARLLLEHSRLEGGFLEIGADIGIFAQACTAAGRFDHAWLYEPNRDVHGELARRLAGQRHSLHIEMWPTDNVPAGSVSTAAMIHVLDHLLEPVAFLGKLWGKLEDNGVVLVVTHNASSLLARALGRRWPPFALQHPQLYSPKSITKLFERSGFSVVKIDQAVNYFPLVYLMRAGLSILGLPPVLPQSGRPIIPVKLGNMAVVVRKRAAA